MDQYLIIILIFINLILMKLVNSRKFKFNRKIISIFVVVQLLFIFWIFYNHNEVLILNVLGNLIDKVKKYFLQIQSAIMSKLNLR